MKKFEGYLIVSDLDGTFLGAKSRIVDENVEAVKYFKENGGLFTFATGRAFYNARVPIPNIEDYVNVPVITSNGMALYDAFEDKVYPTSFLDRNSAIEIVRYASEKYPDLSLRMTGVDGFYLCRKSKYEKSLFSKIDSKYVHIMPYEQWPHDIWLKCVYVGEPDRIDEFEADISRRFPDFEYARSAKNLYEFQTLGTNKGTAVKGLKSELEKKYHRPITAYAVGDYENDLDMLLCADVPVCPENAIPEVKSICKHVFCHHDKGVIADIVRHIEEGL